MRQSTCSIPRIVAVVMSMLLLQSTVVSVSAYQVFVPPKNVYTKSSSTSTTLQQSSTPNNQEPFASSSSSSDEDAENVLALFASEGWKPIKKELDAMPVFCCANEKGQPMQYNVNGATMPFFYCEVAAVEAELKKAKDEMSSEISEQLGIIPFPLGNAFELMAKNQAAVIPSATALQAAGAPEGTNPLGQQVPLFCCMEIMQETPDGQALLPLFMVHEEAKKARDEAIAADGGAEEEFEIASLSLARAVELLATVPESPAFHFFPPHESVEYIETYLVDKK